MLYRALSIMNCALWSYWAYRAAEVIWPIDGALTLMTVGAFIILALREFYDAIKKDIPA